MLEKLFQGLDDMREDIDRVRFPNGGKETPARSCKDIYLDHPEFSDGKLYFTLVSIATLYTKEELITPKWKMF